jgi:hypothetical protein
MPLLFETGTSNILRNCSHSANNPLEVSINQVDNYLENNTTGTIELDVLEDTLKNLQTISKKMHAFLYKEERLPILMSVVDTQVNRNRVKYESDVASGFLNWIESEYLSEI